MGVKYGSVWLVIVYLGGFPFVGFGLFGLLICFRFTLWDLFWLVSIALLWGGKTVVCVGIVFGLITVFSFFGLGV